MRILRDISARAVTDWVPTRSAGLGRPSSVVTEATCGRGIPPTDHPFMHVRTNIVLELAVVVLIDVLWQVADLHFLVVCSVVR